MSDTTGDRPADHTPANAPAGPPVPPAPQPPQAPQPQWGSAPQVPVHYPGYPQLQQQPPYGAPRPQGYGAQPQPGQPYASSFGPAAQANQTQPTQPITGASPAPAAT